MVARNAADRFCCADRTVLPQGCLLKVRHIFQIWRSCDHALWHISIVKPTRYTILRVYWLSLYMFRTVFSSIIRSSRLYTQHQVHVIQVSWMHVSGHETELQFHLVPASMQSTNLYDMHLMLCVQSWTPDDGRKDRPKHVEWQSVNSQNCASSCFYYRNTLQNAAHIL